MIWDSVSRFMRGRFRRGDRARLELAEAYIAVGNTPAGKIVLADLANFTGFFEVTEAFAPPEIRAFNDGKRAAFGRLFHFLNLSDEERSALAAAARFESQTDAAQGPIDP